MMIVARIGMVINTATALLGISAENWGCQRVDISCILYQKKNATEYDFFSLFTRVLNGCLMIHTFHVNV